jgi:hypothetical protein
MSPVATRPRPAPSQSRRNLDMALIAAAVAVLALLVVMPATRLPSFVDRVTIVNPHPWSVHVDVTGDGRDGRVALAGVGPERTRTVTAVIDHGETWIFEFAYGGADGGELVVNRAELEDAGWRITVPEEFAARMRAAGMEPSTP